MTDEPATFAATLSRLADDDAARRPRRPRINGGALLTLNERAGTLASEENAAAPAAAYEAWVEPGAREVSARDFVEADAALLATTGLAPLRALRRACAVRLHPDLVPDRHKAAAEDLMRRINGAIDATRSRKETVKR